MLFVTVYGPELEALYFFIQKQTLAHGNVSREHIYASFVPHAQLSLKGRTKNIDDGLAYLKSACLIEGEEYYTSSFIESHKENASSFPALLLRRFRNMEQNFPKCIMADHLYITLLEQIYILPDRVWVSDVHTAINQLELAKQMGGVSIEKVGAWKRVMEFLGLGYRMGNGFYCQFHPTLLSNIIRQWSKQEGTLQEFLEDYLQAWLPCINTRGEIALPVASIFLFFEHQGYLCLSKKQDSPSRPYFGTRQLRGIKIV